MMLTLSTLSLVGMGMKFITVSFSTVQLATVTCRPDTLGVAHTDALSTGRKDAFCLHYVMPPPPHQPRQQKYRRRAQKTDALLNYVNKMPYKLQYTVYTILTFAVNYSQFIRAKLFENRFVIFFCRNPSLFLRADCIIIMFV